MASDSYYEKVLEAIERLPDGMTRDVMKKTFERAREMDAEGRIDAAWEPPMRVVKDLPTGTVVYNPDTTLGYIVHKDDGTIDVYTSDYVTSVKPDSRIGVVMLPTDFAYFLVTFPVVQHALYESMNLYDATLEATNEMFDKQPAPRNARVANTQQALLRAFDRGSKTA